jgi:hypothetical protein
MWSDFEGLAFNVFTIAGIPPHYITHVGDLQSPLLTHEG